MRRPTRRGLVVGSLGVLLILAGITAQAGWLFVLAAGVLGLVAMSLVSGQHLGSVAIERRVPPRARAGDDVRIGFEVRNMGSRSLPLLRVDDRFEAVEQSTFAVDRIPKGATARVEIVRTALLRGRFTHGEATVVGGAPFGFVRSRSKMKVDSHTIVVPRWVDLQSFPIDDPSAPSTDIQHARSRAGIGEDYLGVREYRPGDPRRFVHWRSTARIGSLMVREFEEQAASPVAIVIAGMDHGVRPDSSFEMLVSAAASIGIYALDHDHAVDLVGWDGSGISMLRGTSETAMLEWLALLEAEDTELGPLIEAALPALNGGGTVVICAPAAGATGEGVARAVARVRGTGAQPIVVSAISSSWVEDEVGAPQPISVGAPIRMVSRGKDLQECLRG